MTSPLVTVITTVHNLAPYIERCIQSVLDQSYPHWEQVIVDDGSTDGTEQLIARFADPRIRYIRLPHRGIAALAESYNTALASSNGSLVGILEGDDYWPADKLEQQVPGFHDPSVQLSWGRAIIVDRGNRELRNWPPPRIRAPEIPLEELFRKLTCGNSLTPTVTVMVRRSALDAIGGFQQPGGALFVDLPTWLKISAHVRGSAVVLKSSLGYYRAHDAQISTQHSYEYHTVQSAIVEWVIGECTPAELAYIGWSEEHARASRASANLMAGIAYLRARQYKSARKFLLSAAFRVPSARAKIRAALGVASTILPYDFVAAADRARRVLLSASLAITGSKRASR